MGNRHPLSLKLKRNIKWSSIIYKYNINKERNQEKIINKIILHKYKNRLISKPVYEYISNRIEVIIMEYKRNKEEEEIKLLEEKIKEKINKEIKINKIRIKKPILDSKILGEYIMKRISKNSINRIRKRLKKMIKIPKMKQQGEYTYNWIEIKKEYINKKIRSYIKGVYIEIKGRISKGRRAKRSTKNTFSIGSIEFNKITNLVDYTQIKRNGENGVYTLKVGINTDIISR